MLLTITSLFNNTLEVLKLFGLSNFEVAPSTFNFAN